MSLDFETHLCLLLSLLFKMSLASWRNKLLTSQGKEYLHVFPNYPKGLRHTIHTYMYTHNAIGTKIKIIANMFAFFINLSHVVRVSVFREKSPNFQYFNL